MAFLPFTGRYLVAFKKLLESLAVNVKGRVRVCMPGNQLNDIVGDFLPVIPVMLEPLLELRDLRSAFDLDVELYVFGEPRTCEIAGADQRLGTEYFRLGMGYVGFSVELFFVIDPAFDLAEMTFSAACKCFLASDYNRAKPNPRIGPITDYLNACRQFQIRSSNLFS